MMVTDHCLYVLLRSATCRPDLTVGGLYWQAEDKSEGGHEHEHEHGKRERGIYVGHHQDRHKMQRCVKWGGVEEWLSRRLINQTADGVVEGLLSPEGITRHIPASELGEK